MAGRYQTNKGAFGVAPGARDHRIDWLRGVALVTIFVNHMPFNRFGQWTWRNFGFSDASELFVLLAGMAAAFAFFSRFERGEHAAILVKIRRRAVVLYGAHLASTLAAIALFAGATWLLGDPRVNEAIGVRSILDMPVAALGEILIGNRQLTYFNILPVYVVLFAMLPGMLWLAVRDVRLMLAVSATIYLAAQILPIEAPNYLTNHGWYFNPLAWQLNFAIGIALGVLRLRGKFIPWNTSLGALAFAYLVFAFVWTWADAGARVSFDTLPEWMDTLAKGKLPPTRLLHLMALAYLLVHSPLWSLLARVSAANVFVRLGRASLQVFVLGSLLSMIGWITLAFAPKSLLLEIALIGAGILLMSRMAAMIEAGVFGRLRDDGLKIARAGVVSMLAGRGIAAALERLRRASGATAGPGDDRVSAAS